MNIAALAASALRRAPASARGPIVFTHSDGRTTTGTGVGVPASGSPADAFKDRQMIRDRSRTVFVLPDGLTFAPLAAMTARWGAVDYHVLAVSPLSPGGDPASTTTPDPAVTYGYRVTLSR